MYATIDIGTNAVLLLIAERNPRGIRVLRDEARITRLGEGLHGNPFFLPAAQEKTLRVLKEYRSLCDGAGVKRIVAVGTAAFRKAKNALDFVSSVEKETGICIEVISGEEEARFSYLSVERDFGRDHSNLIALDIGGGSTEIISKEGGISLDLGAVVLTESIVRHDPPTEGEIKKMVGEIDTQTSPRRLKASPLSLLRRGDGGEVALIGLAGSVTTLSAIKQKLVAWDGTKVQGSILTMGDIDPMISLFRRTTNEERSTIPGMVAGREDTILAGTLILKKVMERLGTDRVIVSDRGLRYGLVYEVLSGNSVWAGRARIS